MSWKNRPETGKQNGREKRKETGLGKYVVRKGKYLMICLFVAAAFNLYFIFLMETAERGYLYYLDLLLVVCGLLFFGMDYGIFRKNNLRKWTMLACEEIISPEMTGFDNMDIAAHDVNILRKRLERKEEENSELQDYVAGWSHEVKVPLAAAFLLSESLREGTMRMNFREQLEKINASLNTMLVGCRLQSSLMDVQIRKASLRDCVRKSIRNQQFFLVQKHFTVKERMDDTLVYTDPVWLIYVLDQLISNAVKYAEGNPEINISFETRKSQTDLYIRDEGEGIKRQDIGRIFEKGYTGSSHHNDQHKSTGLGLYMAKKITDRLGHEMTVESEYGKYTQFRITFWRKLT